FGDEAVPIDQPSLVGSCLRRRLLAKNVGQQRDGLDVAPAPADFGLSDDGHADCLRGLADGRLPLGRNHQRWRGSLRKFMVTCGYAARDLQIYRAVRDVVTVDQLAQNQLQSRTRHGPWNAQLAQRATEPV